MSMSLIALSIIEKSFNLIRTTREQVEIQLIVQEREENEPSKGRQDTFVSVEDRSTRKKVCIFRDVDEETDIRW